MKITPNTPNLMLQANTDRDHDSLNFSSSLASSTTVILPIRKAALGDTAVILKQLGGNAPLWVNLGGQRRPRQFRSAFSLVLDGNTVNT
jgi:hypothetical protein